MTRPAHRSGTIAQQVLWTYGLLTLGAALVFALVVAAVIAGIARFGTISGSVWDQALQVPRWYAGGFGFYLISLFLPMAVAHGQTRRRFMTEAVPFVAFAATTLAGLAAVGYALEGVLYRRMGWPQTLSTERLFAAPDQLGLVLLEFWLQFAVWMAAGMLIGAGAYRTDEGGMLAVVPALLLILPVETLTGLPALPFVSRLIPHVALPWPAVLLVGVASVLACLTLTWLLVRDMPLRTRPT